MYKPLSHFSVISQFTAEIYASTPISSMLPVILLLKSSHIPKFKTNIYGRKGWLKSILSRQKVGI